MRRTSYVHPLIHNNTAGIQLLYTIIYTTNQRGGIIYLIYEIYKNKSQKILSKLIVARAFFSVSLFICTFSFTEFSLSLSRQINHNI